MKRRPVIKNMADGNETAALFILDTTWDSLPGKVRQKARMLLLDDLGAVIGGTLTQVSKITAGYAAERMQGKEATILLQRKSSTAPGAAMANAYAGNGRLGPSRPGGRRKAPG